MKFSELHSSSVNFYYFVKYLFADKLCVSVASSVTDIKAEVIPFLCHIVRHYTILGVAQQSGPCGSKPSTR